MTRIVDDYSAAVLKFQNDAKLESLTTSSSDCAPVIKGHADAIVAQVDLFKNLFWKLVKKPTCPPGTIDKLQHFKKRLSGGANIMGLLTSKDIDKVDIEKLESILKNEEMLTFPLRLQLAIPRFEHAVLELSIVLWAKRKSRKSLIFLKERTSHQRYGPR